MGESIQHGPGQQRLKFVPTEAITGLPVKRKQVQQACASCRLKKKRCGHVDQDTGGIVLIPDAAQGNKRVRVGAAARTPLPNSSHSSADADASTAATQLLGLSDANTSDDTRPQDPRGRFVGDLNPEGFLIEAVKSTDQRGDTPIGIWKQPGGPRKRGSKSGHSSPDDARSSVLSPSILHGEVARLEEALKTARSKWIERCITDVQPPEPSYAKLRDIYLEKIHPIFPIFASRRLRSLGTDRIDIAIKLSVCLAASTDPAAKNHLRLAGSPRPLPYLEYSSKVIRLIRDLLQEIDFSNRLLDQIRIMACTALYWQPQEEDEWDAPARLFTQAMSIVHSIGLHLEVYDKMFLGEGDSGHQLGHAAQSDNCRRSDIERLFLCIYALDRMICTFYGRPILLSERDFDKDILEYASRQTPCFRLFISVIWELNEVIDLYRPASSSTNKSNFVSVFEKLILDSGAQNEPSSLLATIEVLHHAVSALSVRQTRQDFATQPVESTEGQKEYPHLPDPLLNARRSISADRILQIVKQYDVGPLPFVPYALSIALSVAYRKWRFSQIPMFRTRGRAAFLEVLPVLESWGRIFTSARVNHNLAQKVVEGMEKVADNIKRKAPTSVAKPLQVVVDQDMHGWQRQEDPGSGRSNNAASASLDVDRGLARGLFTVGGPTYNAPQPVSHVNPGMNMDLIHLDSQGTFDWFQHFNESTDMNVGQMDGMFDRNLDPMAPAFWPEYPSWDIDRSSDANIAPVL